MSTADSVALLNDSGFRPRVVVAITAAALDIHGETPEVGHEAKSTKRSELAFRVLQNPPAQVESFAWAIAANPVIASAGINAPDGDIEFVIASIWDDIAGVNPDD